MYVTAWSSDREQSALLLPLCFSAPIRPGASADSLAVVPVSGSPAGRSLSRVRGPRLVPGQQNEDRNKSDFSDKS